ncbi:Uncharacterized protein PECH_007729 [Penicillium ucsense]|uniref:F-box domain-containing protein n=1 Tax=Penicillium ucsense TaxID=2839758 RepID=A0A8J8WIW5_9EURO|nr:Uncharacterized protein PECM_007875 [Penicillium ucsense]KAF7734719.1 Uncharacterized protein PECH_007729 [Penicillium ucsense]
MRPQISPEQQRGQRLYQKGDFKAAIEAFGEALRQPNVDTIGILDNRSATYCKLLQYDLARRDAKKMIKTASDDERGYMRCAKVLILEGKPEKAQEIYAYGLRTMPSEHPKRELLEQLHKKLEDRLLGNRFDPFAVLPLEIAMFIINQFSFREMVGLLRVCKGWERLFCSMSHLWMDINLSGARQKVPWTAIRTYIRRSKAMLTAATIKHLSAPSAVKTLEFLGRCPQLEHLELWVAHDGRDFYQKFKGSKNLKSLVLSPELPIEHDYVGKLLEDLPNLERLTIWNVKTRHPYLERPIFVWPKLLPKLKSITLASQQDMLVREEHSRNFHVLSIPGMTENSEHVVYPKLEELRLDYNPLLHSAYRFPNATTRPMPPLRRLELRGMTMETNICATMPDTIEYLHIQGGASARYLATPLEPPGNRLPRLHTLRFEDTGFAPQQTLSVFLQAGLVSLRTLHINGCLQMTVQDLLNMVREFPELGDLTELSVINMPNLDDHAASSILSDFSKLKVLDISCTEITGVTIRRIADTRLSGSTEVARLDRLIARNCEGISPDAITYGREIGLQIIT